MKTIRHSILTMLALIWASGLWTARAEEAVTEAAQTDRDPFWPVNYIPPSRLQTPIEEENGQENALDLKNLTEEQRAKIKARVKISGIFKHSDKFVARINNQLVSAGDTVAVEFEGKVYRFKIKNINKDNVQLEPAES